MSWHVAFPGAIVESQLRMCLLTNNYIRSGIRYQPITFLNHTVTVLVLIHQPGGWFPVILTTNQLPVISQDVIRYQADVIKCTLRFNWNTHFLHTQHTEYTISTEQISDKLWFVAGRHTLPLGKRGGGSWGGGRCPPFITMGCRLSYSAWRTRGQLQPRVEGGWGGLGIVVGVGGWRLLFAVGFGSSTNWRNREFFSISLASIPSGEILRL